MGEASEAPAPVGVERASTRSTVMITGSRKLEGDARAERTLRAALDALLSSSGFVLLIHGGARGADAMGERWAKERRVRTRIYRPEYKKYKRGAPLVRNLQMIKESDVVVAFWDGKSRGTKHVIDNCSHRACGGPTVILHRLDCDGAMA